MGRKVIIDCDPGIDDAVALALALFDPRLEVVARCAVESERQSVCGLAGVGDERERRRVCALLLRLAVQSPVYFHSPSERPEGRGTLIGEAS